MISDQSSITVPQDSHKMETKLTRVVFGPDPESGVENVKVSLNTCIVDVQSFGDKHKHGSCAEPHTNGIIYKWYHASQNSTELVNSVCSKSLSVDMSSAVRQIWVSKERLASIGPSSKVPPFMSPFVRTITSQGNVTQREKCTVIVLPYLATENLTAIISRQRTIDSLLSGSRVFLPGYNPPILDPLPTHLPRTLSQFLYPTLSETAEQIIKQKRSGINQDSTGCLMAHQLWLITVGEECVVTLFPQMEDNETGVTSSLYGNISRNLQEIKFARSVCSHVIDIAAIMVQEAVMLVHKSREGSLSLLHQYHSLLGNMRQDYYATLAAFKDEQENVSGCLSSEAEGNELLSKVLDASTLQTETWSVKRLVESQIQVVKALLDEVRGQNPETIEHEVGFSVCKNTIKLAEELSEDLDRLSQEIDQVKVDLLNMFDLQQKRASLRASHAAVEQTNSSLELAKNSARQSRVMTVFTAMTVIFLPLSLIASIFSMQVKEYTSQDGPTLSLATYWIYAMPISIVTILSALAWAYPSELREFMSSHYKKMKDMLQTMIL